MNKIIFTFIFSLTIYLLFSQKTGEYYYYKPYNVKDPFYVITMYAKIIAVKNGYVEYSILWGKPKDYLNDLEFSKESEKLNDKDTI